MKAHKIFLFVNSLQRHYAKNNNDNNNNNKIKKNVKFFNICFIDENKQQNVYVNENSEKEKKKQHTQRKRRHIALKKA